MPFMLVEVKFDVLLPQKGARMIAWGKRLHDLIASDPVQYELEEEAIREVKERHAKAADRYGPVPLIGAVGAYQTVKMVKNIQAELAKLACPGTLAEYDIHISSDSALPALCGEFAPELPDEDDDCSPILRGPD